MNYCSGRMVRQPIAPGLLVCGALVALALPLRAHAEFVGRAAASAQFESNSNVFDLDSGTRPGGGSSDTYFAYGAELAGVYVFGRQQLYARLETKQFQYQRFTQLDHNDYRIVSQFIWKVGDNLDGLVGVTRSHTMVPFLDLAESQSALSISTQQREIAQVHLKLSSDWKVDGTATTTKSDQPVAGAPSLQLVETAGTSTLKYLGTGRFTSGLSAGYLTGSYSGSTNTLNSSPSYHQSQASFVASFLSRRSIFEGQVGYTSRGSSAGNDATSGLTGLLDFTYQQTPKTSWRVKIDRAVNSFVLNSGSEIDTDVGAGISWRSSYKLYMSLEYTYNYRDYPGQGNNPPGSDRIDHQQFATFAMTYQPRRWLMIRPYANWQVRRTNFTGRDSNSTLFGVSLTVQTSDTANQNTVPLEIHWH